jgi:hypothetical protein
VVNYLEASGRRYLDVTPIIAAGLGEKPGTLSVTEARVEKTGFARKQLFSAYTTDYKQ